MITKPLLAVNFDPDQLKFPVLASPKIDGIRCLKIDGKAVSRTFKPIPNHHIRNLIEAHLPDNVDGELFSGNNFQDSTSAVMTHEGEPTFTYIIFDYVPDGDITMPYDDRMICLSNMYRNLPRHIHEWAKILLPVTLYNISDLEAFESESIKDGFEGIMLRLPNGKYKCGRSTLKEGILLKVKRFEDAEATVIGFEELMHNANEAKTDNLGYTDRATCKDNLVPMDTLGALKVMDTKTNQVFSIGTGFTADQRKHIWNNKDTHLGKLAKYKFQPHGVKEAPRCPVFLGFRDPGDV